MYFLTIVCLLGFATAQKVTELASCLTKENNLRMDCKYELTAKEPVVCKYTEGDKVVGSTDSTEGQDSTFKNRANVTIMEGNTCRLSLKGLSDTKPKNFTCTIKQKETVTKMATVEKKALLQCSALSILLHSGSGLLLTMMMLHLLLEVQWL